MFQCWPLALKNWSSSPLNECLLSETETFKSKTKVPKAHFGPYSYGSIFWRFPGRPHPFLRNPMIPEYHVTPSCSWLCRYILWKARRASRSLTHGAWVVTKMLPDVVRWCATICMRVIVWGRRVTTAELDVTETLLTVVKKTVACWEFFCCCVFFFILLAISILLLLRSCYFSPAWTPQYIWGESSTTQEPEKEAASSTF
jgi:hypothetical protein